MSGDGIFFVLVGPSGAGKNTLINRVKAHLPDLSQVATMTTREKRENEQDAREHHFVTLERFRKAIEQNELIEYQRVHQNDWYGTPRAAVDQAIALGTDLIADIEFLGAEKLHLAYPKHTVLIFVTPSNLRILAERILNRGNITHEELTGRLDRARFEMTYAPECHYLVVNDDRDEATKALRNIIATERHLRRGQAIDGADLVPAHKIDACVTAVIQRGDQVLVQNEQLPRFEIERGKRHLHEVAREQVESLLSAPVQIIGPLDERFDYPAPSVTIVNGTEPHFVLDYYYRFTIPDEDRPVPDGWQWAPLTSVELPDLLAEMVTS